MEEIPVKVAVRLRPLLSREILHSHQVCVRVIPNTQQVVIGKDRVFTFDFIFGNKSSQDDVYTNCIKPLVVSLIEGYNATVFAYGQTGSGKTYTIGGGHVACVIDEEKGIIPHAIQELFQSISENPNIDFSVKVSYIEVYKEELRDLLELDTSIKDLHIREDEKGNTVIVGAKECQVESADELMSLLETGNAARHTGTTQMNEHSSRSHAIFTISIYQQRPKEPQKNSETVVDGLLGSVQMISSKFHFVDLAGSERVTKTGNTGERFKESIQINSGLLALGNVISALGDPKRKSAHIPYRDAKITRILKDSLGGNAKTVMIACISPSSSDFDESLNTLKYANRARNIKNKPIVNYNPDWDRMDEMELEIKALREALQNQRASVMAQASQVSQDWSLEKARIRSLEEQLAQLQLECFNYRNCVEEAFTFLIDLKDMVKMRRSQQLRLQDWLSMAEGLRMEMPPTPGIDSGIGNGREEPYHITILQLKRELKKCQDALASDEEVFSQKEQEQKNLQEQIQALIQENQEQLLSLKEAEQMHTLQNEKMIEQQLLIEELQDKLVKLTASQQISEDRLVPAMSFQRSYSVPLTHNSQPFSISLLQSIQMSAVPKSRKVHTSPPMYCLDRVVAGFRTRSQMVIDRLEQQDEVLHCQFSDQSDEDEDEKNKENRKNSAFRRSINRTWTRKQAPLSPALELSTLQCQIPKHQLQNESMPPSEASRDIDGLRESQELNMKNLKHSELRLIEAKQKIREITINIKMKEELIKELIKTGKDAHSINKQYSLKISKLEQEAEQAKTELSETQKQLQELESKELRDVAQKAKLQKDFRKKMDAAKLKVQVLQKKQQDTKKLASLSSQNEKRVADLEQNVDHMRQQLAQLQKKLREETEKKRKLETEIQRDQQQIKELQLKTEQQQKILKLKNEEIASIRRRKSTVSMLDQLQKLEEQKKWLDEEVEKVLHQRRVLNELEEDLKKRETAMAKREALLKEKSHLEIKKLRSSQALNKDLLKLSSRLSLLDQELSDKSFELQSSSKEQQKKISEEVQVLQKERDLLLRRRGSLDEKLKNGRVLSPEEEHNLFQLEEGIEALEAAIDFRNESIQSRQYSLKATSQILSQSEANVMEKFSSLSPSEVRSILVRYFNKVVGLREAERKLQLQLEEMGMRNMEQENIVRELEFAVEHLTLQSDRRVTLLQKEHEQKMQLLLQHLKDQDGDGIAESIKIYETKVQQLEKDLFFYKNSSRELKKKLRELVGDIRPQQLPSVKHNGTGDGIQVQEETGALSEAFRWISKLEHNKINGKLKETDTGAPDLRMHQQHYRHWEDVSDNAQSPALVELSRRHLSSSEDQLDTEEIQSSKPPTHVLSHSQMTENITLLQGKTPVKVSRRELRQISASELSLRRSSLGTSGSIAADSIEISRKSTDFKT
ncbi:kinesin-like protein KIF27 isoform X2 [Rhinatrema bivittatum]|uniref:kinesin-like protein KIF27 isoform X2 n=1 Tax=Rhinatrema bivittatum TaxID=194408 RepID=UPI00112EEA65|nr:kinesin-like protein KIF27 isoform X2 [Rhinatrema bivittatum]